jgi:MFS family permease
MFRFVRPAATSTLGCVYSGRMSDRLGHKRVLIVTLLLHLLGTGAAVASSSWSSGLGPRDNPGRHSPNR